MGVLLLCSLGSSLSAYALEAQDVRVVGLFSNTAVVKILGKQHLLKVGQTSPEGVELRHADAHTATLVIDGREYRMTLSRDPSGGYQTREVASLKIDINERGQYITPGAINGRSVTFLVDTGATSVAMNSEMARILGIDFAAGQRGQSSTAGGVVNAWRVTLDRVKVGDIEVRNVQAAVLEGMYPTYVLLGMTFLSQVEIVENAGLLTLTKKY
jgi:aspartyl protease family protein